MPLPTFQVLLVEDHPADIALTRKAFDQLSIPATLHVVVDGREAMDFLRQGGRFSTSLRPDLVLLDLNMPRMGGIEVLREIDDDLALRSIPVIVLTTSSAPSDINKAYLNCANSYVVKPVKFAHFLTAIDSLIVYWTQVASIPRDVSA